LGWIFDIRSSFVSRDFEVGKRQLRRVDRQSRMWLILFIIYHGDIVSNTI